MYRPDNLDDKRYYHKSAEGSYTYIGPDDYEPELTQNHPKRTTETPLKMPSLNFTKETDSVKADTTKQKTAKETPLGLPTTK